MGDTMTPSHLSDVQIVSAMGATKLPFGTVNQLMKSSRSISPQ